MKLRWAGPGWSCPGATPRSTNDRFDARTLAELLAVYLIPRVWISDERTRAQPRLTSRRAQLVRQRTRVKNEASAVLARKLKGRAPVATCSASAVAARGASGVPRTPLVSSGLDVRRQIRAGRRALPLRPQRLELRLRDAAPLALQRGDVGGELAQRRLDVGGAGVELTGTCCSCSGVTRMFVMTCSLRWGWMSEAAGTPRAPSVGEGSARRR